MAEHAFNRMNYLSQSIEHLVQSNIKANLSLIHYYSKCLAVMAEKKCSRLDPSIKRKLCRKCYMYLVPGTTCTVRLRSGRQSHRVVTCLLCGAVRRYNNSADKFHFHSADGNPRETVTSSKSRTVQPIPKPAVAPRGSHRHHRPPRFQPQHQPRFPHPFQNTPQHLSQNPHLHPPRNPLQHLPHLPQRLPYNPFSNLQPPHQQLQYGMPGVPIQNPYANILPQRPPIRFPPPRPPRPY